MGPILKLTLLSFALGVAGCSGNDFDKVSEVEGVRVLAVRPEAPHEPGAPVPASGQAGDTLELRMLYLDGRVPLPEPGASLEPLPNLAWLGGCHNPPSRFYYACGPVLGAVAAGIENGAELPPGFFGTESPFPVPLPDDILTNAPFYDTDPIHFGISFAFFGVCTGTFVPRPERTEGIPLDCVDSSGKALGARDFVVGFTTLYTYEGVQNLNPEILNVRFDGNPVAGADCAEEGSCPPPTVPACAQGEDCPQHSIVPELAQDSFEHTPDGAWEILWTSYYGTHGEFEKESQLASDRVSGPVANYTSGWRAPSTPGTVRLWVTVNDERGGAHWATFDVIVE